MADMYDNSVIISNATSTNPPPDNDDISILLHQLLSRSSSSSSSLPMPCPPPPPLMSQTIHSLTPFSHFSPENQRIPPPHSLLSGPTRFSAADSYPVPYFHTLESIDNDPDDYDYDNEVQTVCML